MQSLHSLSALPDDELLHRLAALVRQSRSTEADLVAHIGEVDTRHLYLREATPSMFQYCTERLHLSGAEAYLRIAAARVARDHPVILAMLADGRLHLTAIAMVAPHLTPENRDTLLERATHRSKREIEELLAEIAPRPDAPSLIRKLPDRQTQATPALQSPAATTTPSPSSGTGGPTRNTRSASAEEGTPPALGECDLAGRSEIQLRPDGVASGSSSRTNPRSWRVEPLSPSRYKVEFTASAELRERLVRLQDLMRTSVPNGDLASVIDAAVTEKLERLERRRFGATKAPLAGEAKTPVADQNQRAAARAEASFRSEPVPTGAESPVPTGREASPALPESPVPEESPASSRTPTTVLDLALTAASGGASTRVESPRRSRHVPAAVRRAVHDRDGTRCAFVDAQGRRCTARAWLEFHHRHTFALGGEHSPANVAELCKQHNRYVAEIDYGRQAMSRFVRRGSRSRRSSS